MKEVAKEQMLTQCAAHAQYVLQLLQLQQQTGFLCDITIQVKDCSFKAHKPLLAACSLYFRFLIILAIKSKEIVNFAVDFTNHIFWRIRRPSDKTRALFADINTNDSTALNLTSLTPTGFEVLLDYIYSGNLSINAENSSEVLSAATCLQMSNVVETCLNFIRSSFRMSKTDESNSAQPKHNQNAQSSNTTTHSGYSVKTKKSQETPNLYNLPYVSSLQSNKPVKPQKSLHIVSATTIDEAEFKNMVTDKTNRCGAKITPFSDSFSPVSNPDSVVSSSQKSQFSPFGDSSSREANIDYCAPSSSVASDQLNPRNVKQEVTLPDNKNSTPSAATSASGHSPSTTARYQPPTSKSSYSSDEHDNCVEISSDDDSGGNLWSAERSGREAPDLSYTPYSATTSKQVCDFSSSKLDEAATTVNAASPQRRSSESTKISGADSRVITFEKAMQATSVLCPPNRLTSVSSEEGNPDDSNLPTISSEVIHKTLLPKKLAKSLVRSPSGMPNARSSFDTADLLIKTEPNDDQNLEGFVPRATSNDVPAEDKLDPALSIDDFPKGNSRIDSGVILDLSLPVRPQSPSPAELSFHKEESTLASVTDSEVSNSPLSSKMSRMRSPELSLAWSKTDSRPSFLSRSLSLSANQRPVDEELESWNSPTDLRSRDSLSKLDFSSKPRKNTGGYTCTWPGCGRWFRHQNIFCEHQRLHEVGIPVTQLRKCYIGARVKKTVREQLEELRTKEGTNDSLNKADHLAPSKPKKRRPTCDEPVRKRVHAKDKLSSTQLLKQFAAVRSVSTATQLQQQPRHPASFVQAYVRNPFPNLPGSIATTEARRKEASLNRFGAAYSNTVASVDVSRTSRPLYSPTSTAQLQKTTPAVSGISPVQQTLALLGIPFSSPYPSLNPQPSVTHSIGLSPNQIRRRLALHETTSTDDRRAVAPVRNKAVVSPSTREASSVTFDPGIRRSRSLNVPLARMPIRPALQNNNLSAFPTPTLPSTVAGPSAVYGRDYL